MISCDHCILCPSIYGFWLPLWCRVAIVLSDLLFTASDYHFGILWPLYYLSFYLRLLITTFVSCGHCILCPSIYGFWLPLWYLVVIVLSDLLTASDYHFGILWPLYYLSFYLRFWLPLWYLVAIVLSVLLFTASDYHFGILWPLYYLSFYLRLLITTLVSCGHCIIYPFISSDYHFGILWSLYYLSFYLRLLITTLVSCGHGIICPSIYGFWLPLWYLVAIVLYVLLFTASDYHFGKIILWPLYYLAYLRLLITTLESCGHCIICPTYGFWLPLWYLVAIVLSVLLFTASDYHFGVLWSCDHCIICPSIYGFWLPLWYLAAIVLSVLLFTASNYHFGILWPLYYLSFYLRLLITTLVSCGHCIICPSIYGFWLPLWYLMAIVLSVLLFTASDYHFGVLWPLYYLTFYLRLLITTLVSCGHCIICPSIYGFWWPLWCLVAIVLSVLLFTASDYQFGILRPLYYMSFYLRLLITTLVSCGHCIICPSIYGFWLPLWYLVTIVLYVLLFTASDYHFGILWPLYYLSFYLRLLIIILVSCGHCIICPSIYGFWLPLWYLVAIVLSDLFTASDYHIGILWPLYYLSFYLRLLITTLVSCGHCIICPSIYGFWLPLWYLVAIVLSVLLFTASD